MPLVTRGDFRNEVKYELAYVRKNLKAINKEFEKRHVDPLYVREKTVKAIEALKELSAFALMYWDNNRKGRFRK